jgi:hypothetical protein
MKRILITSLVLFTVMACEKPSKESKDYRDQWVGTYECEEIYSWWSVSSSSGEKIFQTKVEIAAIGDSILKVAEIRNESSYKVEVNSKGEFIKQKNNAHDSYVSGNFIGESIYMTIIPSHGLGNGSNSEYKGKKK